MSGIKETYVQLTESQRDSMLSQCRELRDDAARQRERTMQLERLSHETQSMISALDNKVGSQIVGLSNEMRIIEHKQNEAFRNALDLQGASIRYEMQQQRQELAEMIGNIEQQIRAKEKTEKKIAQRWIEQAEAYLAGIDNFRHDLFYPNRLWSQKIRLEQSRIDTRDGTYQSAISTAREVFNNAVELRADVVAAELKWTQYFEHLSRVASELSSEINDAKLLEIQVGEEKIKARVDYWTDGALTIMEKRLAEIQRILQKPDNANSDTLVALIIDVDNLSQQLNEPKIGLIDSAKIKLMLSAQRADMVNDIVCALVSMGWKIPSKDDYSYKHGQEKEALHVKITDGVGNECVIIIDPQNNQGNLLNKLELNFFNENEYDTSSTETYISSIKQELADNGVRTDLRCVDGYEDKPSDRESVRNIEQIRQKKGS